MNNQSASRIQSAKAKKSSGNVSKTSFAAKAQKAAANNSKKK
jgi:hypothetical protein